MSNEKSFYHDYTMIHIDTDLWFYGTLIKMWSSLKSYKNVDMIVF